MVEVLVVVAVLALAQALAPHQYQSAPHKRSQANQIYLAIAVLLLPPRKPVIA
jgi:type II secretory pathway pseudopilin PulG